MGEIFPGALREVGEEDGEEGVALVKEESPWDFLKLLIPPFTTKDPLCNLSPWVNGDPRPLSLPQSAGSARMGRRILHTALLFLGSTVNAVEGRIPVRRYAASIFTRGSVPVERSFVARVSIFVAFSPEVVKEKSSAVPPAEDVIPATLTLRPKAAFKSSCAASRTVWFWSPVFGGWKCLRYSFNRKMEFCPGWKK